MFTPFSDTRPVPHCDTHDHFILSFHLLDTLTATGSVWAPSSSVLRVSLYDVSVTLSFRTVTVELFLLYVACHCVVCRARVSVL